MLLLLCSINLFGQTITPIDSLVTIDISTIRRANEKLIEIEYLKTTITNQDDIISSYKELYEKQDSLIYKYQIRNITLENELLSTKNVNEGLNNSINKKNKIITILGGVSAASLITTILCLLIR